jgi:hypothetical protein
MRLVALLAIVLLLSGCTWVRRELAMPPTSPTPAQTSPAPKPEPVRPSKPRPRVETPAAPPQAVPQADAPPPIDYEARCRTMASNRADDAKQLGASPADQAKMQNDTYRNCMAESVK